MMIIDANLLQNLIPVILLRPLLFIVPDTTASQIRIMLLKATHAPFLGAIWVFERWEVLALRREEEERVAMGLDLDVNDNPTSTTTSTTQPQVLKSKTNTSSASKKHSLTKTGKVKIPAALLAQASKRPTKKVGASQDTNGRVKVTTGTLTATNGAAVAAPPPPPGPAPEPTNVAPETGAGQQPSQALGAAGAADVAEMMRLLKELSVQVEEVRSALVKHDAGPSVD